MNMLRNGIARAAEHLDTHASEVVIFRRGASMCELPATFGATEWMVDSAEGTESWQSLDFLVTASRLVLSSGQVTPRRGDLFERTDNNMTRTYEVMSPEAEDVVKECDPYGLRLRVHTKMRADS